MKVLVVVDMQNDFIDGSLGTKEAQAIVPGVAEKIRNFEGRAIMGLLCRSRQENPCLALARLQLAAY